MKPKNISDSHQAILNEIGNQLKQFRKEKNITYVNAAKEMGINKNTLNSMENGRLNFQFTSILITLEYYSVSIQHFFSDISEKNKL